AVGGEVAGHRRPLLEDLEPTAGGGAPDGRAAAGSDKEQMAVFAELRRRDGAADSQPVQPSAGRGAPQARLRAASGDHEPAVRGEGRAPDAMTDGEGLLQRSIQRVDANV